MEQYFGNYTGPFWSDGKIQPSVEWGEAETKNALDELSRQHDSAYAHFKDEAHREAADIIYQREAKKLIGRFPHLAGELVLHGNRTYRGGSELLADTKFLGPVLGAAYWQVKNMVKSHKMMTGTYLKNELNDVQQYYSTDPKLKTPSLGEIGRQPGVKGNLVTTKQPLETVRPIPKNKVAPAPRVDTSAESREAERVERLKLNQARRVQNYLALKEAAIHPMHIKTKKKKTHKRLAMAVMGKKTYNGEKLIFK